MSASAATQVDVALASPPESDAPRCTTAAIGASRYAAPKAGSTVMRMPASRTAATRVEDTRCRVREYDVCPDAQAGHPRGSRVRAHRLEPPAGRRVAKQERDGDRDRSARPEDGADAERLLRAAHDESAPGTCSEFVTSRAYLRLQAKTICPTASVTISGLSLHDPDEDPVDESHERSEAEAGEDPDRQPVVEPTLDADEQVPAEGDHARSREVDAGLHDHEHLPERRDCEDRHVREDEGPRRVPQRVRRDDRGDDHEHCQWRARPAGIAPRRERSATTRRAPLVPAPPTRSLSPGRSMTGRSRAAKR